MVDKDGEGQERPDRSLAWPKIFERWQLGESEDVLARDFGFSPVTIKDRCRWVEKFFPPSAPVRLLSQLARRLNDSHTALVAGAALDAERQAKAVMAIIRATQALESWAMEQANSKTPEAPVSEPEVSSDYDDPRAELERRLLRLVDIKAKHRYQAGVGAGEGGRGPDRKHLCPSAELGGQPREAD